MDKQRRHHPNQHHTQEGTDAPFVTSRSGTSTSAAMPSLFYHDLNFLDGAPSSSPTHHPQPTSSQPETPVDSSMLYYDHASSFPSTNGGAASTSSFPTNRRRKNSIEMFLSRSPSQHLGSDFFKLALDDPSDFTLDSSHDTSTDVRHELLDHPQLHHPPPSMTQPPHYNSSRRSNQYDDHHPSWYSNHTHHHHHYHPSSRPSRHDSSDDGDDGSMYGHPVRPVSSARAIHPRQPHDMRQDHLWQPHAYGGRTAPTSSRRFVLSAPPDHPRPTNHHHHPSMLKPCKFFAQGHCRMGNKCKFGHLLHSNPTAAAIHAQPSTSSSFDDGDFHPFGFDSTPVSIDDLRGRVFAMSKDQNGCRLLQEQLDSTDSEPGKSAADVCTVIYTESLPHLVDMMVDPFGNYLFQKLLDRGDDDQRLGIVQQVAPHLVAAALNLHGTRSVQKVVELAAASSSSSLVALIVGALKDDAVRLCIDSNGNHVIQRALQFLPPASNQFVFDAVAADCTVVGTHRHGCCVLQRCVDAADPVQRRAVIAQVEHHAMKLMQDPYGNYVVQYVLDACSAADARGVMAKCVGHVLDLSIQKFSSNVVEKCLELAPDDLRQTIVREIVASPRMYRMLQDQYANYVVQRALSVASDDNCLDLVAAIRPHLASMKNTQGGRRIQARILKRFPHVDVGWDPDFSDVGGSPATRPVQPQGGSYGRVA